MKKFIFLTLIVAIGFPPAPGVAQEPLPWQLALRNQMKGAMRSDILD